MLAHNLKIADLADLPPSFLGRASRVTGILNCGGDLTVRGTVVGRINAVRVTLSPEGRIEGDIVAHEVRIEGRLTGRVFALHVAVENCADVTGRIFHNTITVARGARIDGRMPWRPPNYFENLTQLPEIRP